MMAGNIHPDMRRLLQITTAQSTAESVSNSREISDEDRQFIQNSLAATFDTESYVDKLRRSLLVLCGPEYSIDDKLYALEIMEDIANDIDAARDVVQLDSLVVLAKFIDPPHSDVELQKGACQLIGTVSQNNPICQDAVLEANLLPPLIRLLDMHGAASPDALYAISCLCRHHDAAQKTFAVELDGFSSLIRALQSDNGRLQCKAAFLLNSFASNGHADALIRVGIVEQLIGSLRAPYTPTHEHYAQLLLTLAKNSRQAKEQCWACSALRTLLEARINECSDDESRKEECEYYIDLHTILYTADESGGSVDSDDAEECDR